jgi:hypothetical protein
VTESDETVDEELQEELNIAPEDLPANTTTEDIEGIYVKDKRLFNFPKRMARQFPRLKAIEFDNTELETVTDDEFRGLSLLVYISCPKNKFKMLPGRLFRFNPALKWVKFNDNTQLANIGFNLFKHLQNLIELNFGSTGCTNTTVTDTSLLTRIAGRLLGSCPPDEDDFEEDMDNMECEWVAGEDVSTTTAVSGDSTTGDAVDTTVEEITTERVTTTSIIYG